MMTPHSSGKSRRSTRLKDYDYSLVGAYYVTLCTHQKVPLFGEIEAGAIILTNYGEIAQEEWIISARIRSEIELDAYVVMPNHIHAVVIIAESASLVHDVPRDKRPITCGGEQPVGPSIDGSEKEILEFFYGRFQISDHKTHQHSQGNTGPASLAEELLRPHHTGLCGIGPHSGIHRRKPSQVAVG